MAEPASEMAMRSGNFMDSVFLPIFGQYYAERPAGASRAGWGGPVGRRRRAPPGLHPGLAAGRPWVYE
jgi:hypothetical protein